MDADGLTPVAGGIVALLDETGSPVARALTDDLGRAVLRAPRAGSYRLRSARIGYTGMTSEPFALRTGEEREFRLDYRDQLQPVREIVLTETPLCGAAALSHRTIAILLDEARKAFESADITRETGALPLEVRTYEWELDRNERRRKTLSQATRVVRTERPFVAAPLHVLRAEGFARRDGAGWNYYAPDAGVLLSEFFLETHCFRVVEGEGKDRGLVGVAFDPLPGAAKPDVAGVLWLNARDGLLTRLDYKYIGLDLPEPAPGAGGRAELARLPSGAWYIARWFIRAPLIGQTRPGPAFQRSDRFHDRQTDLVLAGYHETGGEARPLASPPSAPPPPPPPSGAAP